MGRVARADADCDDYARHEGDVGSRPRVRANTHLCASWTCGPPSAGPRGGRTARKPPSRGWLTVTGTARTSAAHAEWRLIVKVSPNLRFFGLFNERNVRLNVHTIQSRGCARRRVSRNQRRVRRTDEVGTEQHRLVPRRLTFSSFLRFTRSARGFAVGGGAPRRFAMGGDVDAIWASLKAKTAPSQHAARAKALLRDARGDSSSQSTTRADRRRDASGTRPSYEHSVTGARGPEATDVHHP